MSDFRNDDFEFQAATIKTRNVDALLRDYQNKGGSTFFSLKNLCSSVAKIIPYSDPNFIYHWSDIARRAIHSDMAENRPVTSIGGTPPPSLEVNEESPVFVFPPSKGKSIESSQQNPIPDSPLPPLPVPPVNKPIQKNPSPCFGTPSVFGSMQNHPPFPSGSGQIFHSSSHFNKKINNETLPPIQSFNNNHKRVQIDDPSVFAPSVQHNFHQKNPQSSHCEKKSKHEHSHKHSRSSYQDVSSSSNSSESSSGSDPEWAFKSVTHENDHKIYKPSPSALRFADGVKSYKHKCSKAVQSFIFSGLKPSEFPASLVPNLLKGKFIKLEKIKGELLAAGRGDCQTMSIGSNSKGVEITAKTSSAIINYQGEWLHYFDIFCETFRNAFPSSSSDIDAYSKFITRQGFSNGKRANWICIANHDDALRRAFADQTFLGFRDWDHPETSLLKTQHMGSAFDNKNPLPHPPIHSNSSKFFNSQPRNRSTIPSSASFSSIKTKFPIKSSTNVPIAEQYCHRWHAKHCPLSQDTCTRLHFCNVDGCGQEHRGCEHPGRT